MLFDVEVKLSMHPLGLSASLQGRHFLQGKKPSLSQKEGGFFGGSKTFFTTLSPKFTAFLYIKPFFFGITVLSVLSRNRICQCCLKIISTSLYWLWYPDIKLHSCTFFLIRDFVIRQLARGSNVNSAITLSKWWFLYHFSTNLSFSSRACDLKSESLVQLRLTRIIWPLGIFLNHMGWCPLWIGKKLFESVGIKYTLVPSLFWSLKILRSKKCMLCLLYSLVSWILHLFLLRSSKNASNVKMGPAQIKNRSSI